MHTVQVQVQVYTSTGFSLQKILLLWMAWCLPPLGVGCRYNNIAALLFSLCRNSVQSHSVCEPPYRRGSPREGMWLCSQTCPWGGVLQHTPLPTIVSKYTLTLKRINVIRDSRDLDFSFPDHWCFTALKPTAPTSNNQFCLVFSVHEYFFYDRIMLIISTLFKLFFKQKYQKLMESCFITWALTCVP